MKASSARTPTRNRCTTGRMTEIRFPDAARRRYLVLAIFEMAERLERYPSAYRQVHDDTSTSAILYNIAQFPTSAWLTSEKAKPFWTLPGSRESLMCCSPKLQTAAEKAESREKGQSAPPEVLGYEHKSRTCRLGESGQNCAGLLHLRKIVRAHSVSRHQQPKSCLGTFNWYAAY
jgi:hypothetical protein